MIEVRRGDDGPEETALPWHDTVAPYEFNMQLWLCIVQACGQSDSVGKYLEVGMYDM